MCGAVFTGHDPSAENHATELPEIWEIKTGYHTRFKELTHAHSFTRDWKHQHSSATRLPFTYTFKVHGVLIYNYLIQVICYSDCYSHYIIEATN